MHLMQAYLIDAVTPRDKVHNAAYNHAYNGEASACHSAETGFRAHFLWTIVVIFDIPPKYVPYGSGIRLFSCLGRTHGWPAQLFPLGCFQEPISLSVFMSSVLDAEAHDANGLFLRGSDARQERGGG
jgi:hypothetical protein